MFVLLRVGKCGAAHRAAAGETGPVADAVRVALDEYARHMDQPSVYEDEYSPGGGGISPSV